MTDDLPLLTADQAVDLSNCDREPIHTPGSIQNHGILLALDPSDFTIVQTGADSQRWLGMAPAQLLGRPASALFDTDQQQRLRQTLSQGGLAHNPLYLFTLTANGLALDVTAHLNDDKLLLDLEPQNQNDPGTPNYYLQIKGAIAELQAVGGLQPFCQRLTDSVRALTGMDRVMIYRFQSDDSGWVFAEARRDDLEPYLDLHYPASDIPKQARALYLRNWLRLIADVDAPAQKLLAVGGQQSQPLDLSYSALRSVSPIHIEYLKNMGVRASMSISLINNGRLWGLIACHHYTPRYVPYGLRAGCELLAQLVSLQLAAKEESEHYQYRLKLDAVRERLGARLSLGLNHESEVAERLLDGSPTLLDYIDAAGVAVCIDGQTATLGRTPEPDALAALLAWLAEQRGESVFASDFLARDYPPAAAFADCASGLLAAQISRKRRDFIAWFRPETPQTVTWAGNPEKPVIKGGKFGERLQPRQSFAAWRESVRQRALPWTSADIDAAEKLRLAIVDIVAERVAELGRLNTELSHSNEELDAFAYIASHDLKEPLRGIYGYAQFLLDELSDKVDEKSQQRMQALLRLTRRMENLIDSLLHYSRVGRQDLAREPVDFNTLLNEALELLEHRLKDNAVAVRVPRPLPTIACDPVQVREVLTNLISNAIKYNDKPDAWVEIGYSDADEIDSQWLNRELTAPVFYVRDNGIGIRERHLQRIFTLFKRLHGRDEYGGGTGIGLTIAKKIIERHGGELWVESAPGQGSTFYFTLDNETDKRYYYATTADTDS